ncbi:MAG: alpha/beta hydrolase, partial [Burkholderiales bacterium]
MLPNNLAYIEKLTHPAQTPEYVILWLHGLGADWNDFVPLVAKLNLTKAVKFVFPNAPRRPITINNGFVMRAWYDICDLNRLGVAVDKAGILDSVRQIDELIKQQIHAGFNAKKIILAGFSQGGVMSYTTALMTAHNLAGVIALSAYLPDAEELAKAADNAHKTTPMFAAHGMQDPIVPYQAGLNAYQALTTDGYNISWHEYQ